MIRWYALAFLCACSDPARDGTPPETTPEATPETTPEATPETTTDEPRSSGGRIESGFYVEDGAPDPLACATDAECTYGGVPDETGCCWSFRDMNAVAMSVAYHEWIERERPQNCEGVDCPSPPVPDRPPDCLFQVSCRSGRCANACTP
jgi:hypothetical protein